MEQLFIHVFITKEALYAVTVLTLFKKLIEALTNEILEQETIDADRLAIEALLMQQFRDEMDTAKENFATRRWFSNSSETDYTIAHSCSKYSH